MKTKREKKMSGPVHTLTFNSKKIKKDEKVIQLANEYASVFSDGMEPKIALAHWIKQNLPNEIARLREGQKALKTA